ncbi:PucR family transcriptional regulator [Streptomyces sp. NPDC001156]
MLLGLDLEREHVVLVSRGEDRGGRRRVTDAAGAYATRLGASRASTAAAPSSSCPAPGSRAAPPAPWRGLWPPGPGVRSPWAGSPRRPGRRRSSRRTATRSGCVDVLLALDRAGEGASRDDLGILLGQAGREELARFVRRTIGPLLDHHETRGSALVRTGLTYFARDGSLTRTATGLYIHVNTLYQRIDGISALLGPQWRHGDRALHVHLALKTHLASA